MWSFGLNESIILGVNRRGLDVYDTLQNHSHHGINVIGFIRGYDEPDNFEYNLPLPILGHESNIHDIIKKNNVNDLIIALDKPTPERVLETIVNVDGFPISLKVIFIGSLKVILTISPKVIGLIT